MAWGRNKKSGAPKWSQDEYHKEFASQIREQIKAGVAPWQKPWKPGETQLPANVASERAYRGGNSLYLSVAQTAKGYSDNRWGTYKQIKELGGQVRKGEKGSHVLFYKFDDEQRAREDGPRDESGKPGEPGEQSRPPLVRAYTVFNVEQAEGLKLERREDAEPPPEWKAHQAAELVIRESGVSVHHVRGDRAFYNHNRDTVTLPERDQFATAKQLLPDRDARTRPRHRPRKPDGPRDVDERRRDRLQPRGSEEQLHGDGDGVGRQRRLRHRRRDDQRHGRGRAAAQAGQADAGAGLGLVDGADRDLDGAGAQRRPGDRRLQPAVPGGHVGLVERPPLDAGVIPTREIINLTPDTSYQAQVRAVNRETPSDWSDPSDTVRTYAQGETITSVGVTSTPLGSDTYGAGEEILFTVTFSGAVDVTGNPVFWFWIESNVLPVEAEYESGSGSTSLVFTYTVLSTDEDDDGIYLGGSNDFDQPAGPVRLLDPGDAITGVGSTTPADLVHYEVSGGKEADHKVDGSLNDPSAPTITLVAVTSTPAASDTYGWGETIEISVTFNEAVDATDGTDFELSVGGGSNDRSARLLRGSGSETLVFGYTVVSTDEDDDGIWIGDQDRTLVGDRRGTPQAGTITSVASPSTEADLTHDELGQQGGHKVSSNNPPVFTEGDSTTRTVARSSLPDSDSGPGANVGEPVLARDADNDELRYNLEGDDRSLFIIIEASGQILTLPPGAFGGPTDYSGQDTYQVRVKARDGEGGRDTIAVTINFTGSVDDPPEEGDGPPGPGPDLDPDPEPEPEPEPVPALPLLGQLLLALGLLRLGMMRRVRLSRRG